MPRDRRDDIVVFEILRDTACAECGEALGPGRWLRLEGDRPLCLACADLSLLVFLLAGDAALTRRASRYSTLRAVLVRFSQARKRYERQGVLVEAAAVDADYVARFAGAAASPHYLVCREGHWGPARSGGADGGRGDSDHAAPEGRGVARGHVVVRGGITAQGDAHAPGQGCRP